MQTKRTRNRARSFDRPASPTFKNVTIDQAPRAAVPPLAPRAAPAPPVAPASSPTLDAHGYDPDSYDWVPVPRKRRIDGWSPEKQRAFIGHLADTGSVSGAARQSGMTRESAYRLRRAPEGKAFAAAWDAAIQQAASALVDAAFERAVHGSEEPVWDREGKVIGRRFRQSDAMMMFLLRKHFPDRYGDNYRDRAGPAIAATAVAPPPVADALALLGPVPPADPAATLDPDMLDLALARADNGKLPPDLADPAAAEPDEPDADFEALLEAAQAAADAPPTLTDDDDEAENWDDDDEEEDWDDDDDDDDEEDREDDDPEDWDDPEDAADRDTL